MRNFRKLKTLSDYQTLDKPEYVPLVYVDSIPRIITDKMMVLRMLIKPKYGDFKIPPILEEFRTVIEQLHKYDIQRTCIEDSWCYITIRHGVVTTKTDDEWHFDGSSFRTDIIPERNYVWMNSDATLYKEGNLVFPKSFNPLKHNLFKFAAEQLKEVLHQNVMLNSWCLLSPFCLHRRPKIEHQRVRTFIRVCFTDIEGRDINNTPNSLLSTDAYGRDPVKTFRDNLITF